jgi:hypothetical protein
MCQAQKSPERRASTAFFLLVVVIRRRTTKPVTCHRVAGNIDKDIATAPTIVFPPAARRLSLARRGEHGVFEGEI